MAIPVLVMGRSGSGKTYSLKNFKADEVGVISVEKGRLPFKSDIKVARIKPLMSEEDRQNRKGPEERQHDCVVADAG